MADLERLKPMPLLPVALSIIVGIIATRLTGTLWIGAIFGASAAFLGAGHRYLYSAWSIAAALGSISFYISSGADLSDRAVDSKERIYEANVLSVTENDNSVSANLEIIRGGENEKSLTDCRHTAIRMTCPSMLESLRPGFTIIFRGSLQKIIPQTDLPDEIDPAQLHLDRNIHYRTFIEPSAIISITPTSGILAKLIRYRDHIVDAIYRSSLNPETKIFVAVTLLGDTSDLPNDTRERFSSAGLGHILALSGLHVGIIALIIAIALWPLHASGHRATLSVITIALLWGYAALTGFSPSVTRAVIMASIYLLARALQRNSSAFNSLAAAAVIILLFDPQALFTAGFQLSFCAVAAIIMFAERFNPISRRRRIPYALASYISVSLCAIIGTSIPACIHFHTFPVWFIGANLIASLLLPFLVGGAFVVTICELSGWDPGMLCQVVDILYTIIDRSAEFFGTLPGAVIRNIYLPEWIAAFYCATVISLFFLMLRRTTIRLGLFVGLCVATSAIVIFAPTPDHSPRLFLTHNAYHTDLVVDNRSTTLHIITSAPQEHLDIISRARFRYRDYMGRRQIDSINIVTSPDFQAHGIIKNGNHIRFGNHSILLFNGQTNSYHIPSGIKHIDYAIVCRGYRGDNLAGIIKDFRPDTLILSSDLHPKRSKRYLDECKQIGQAAIDMRSSNWNIGIK